jgi:hypothetical protein
MDPFTDILKHRFSLVNKYLCFETKYFLRSIERINLLMLQNIIYTYIKTVIFASSCQLFDVFPQKPNYHILAYSCTCLVALRVAIETDIYTPAGI